MTTNDRILNGSGLSTVLELLKPKIDAKADATSIITPVQSDWDESTTTSLAYILNKPDLSNFVTSGVTSGLASEEYVNSALTPYVEKNTQYEFINPTDEITYTVDSDVLNSNAGIYLDITSRANDSDPRYMLLSTMSVVPTGFNISYADRAGVTTYYESKISGDASGINITSVANTFADTGFEVGNDINIVSDNISIIANTDPNHEVGRLSITGKTVSITGVTTPTSDTMAANKKYVDDMITSGLTNCVMVSDVIPATGITGTSIAEIGGKTIYAPHKESFYLIDIGGEAGSYVYPTGVNYDTVKNKLHEGTMVVLTNSDEFDSIFSLDNWDDFRGIKFHHGTAVLDEYFTLTSSSITYEAITPTFLYNPATGVLTVTNTDVETTTTI